MTDPYADPTGDPVPTLVEELRAVTQLTRTVPLIVREVCQHAADRMEALEAIIRDLTDPDACAYDHHGYCQAHGWLTEGTCPHQRARAFLASRENHNDETEEQP